MWPFAAARTGSGMTLTERLAIHTSRLLPSTPSVTSPAPSCSSATPALNQARWSTSGTGLLHGHAMASCVDPVREGAA